VAAGRKYAEQAGGTRDGVSRETEVSVAPSRK
jgi:hypothetical protein